MAGLCKAVIIGNLGGDPEMRYSAAGRPFTTFSVACNRNYTGPDGERREETEWFRVTANGKLAEVCSQYLSKGRRVYVEGRLSSRSWEGPDGQRRFTLQINANEMQILDTRPRDEVHEHQMEPDDAGDLDSIPF
ncbi:MAG TPA: single-stranded DNA-binding protein [Chloroflexota bacterium]|nr:single-stranded DNA-binding protein [Chloroflexota bacterium]